MDSINTQRVVEQLKELNDIEREIFKLNMDLKMLRFKRNNIKEDINKYLKEANQPGVKYGDIIVLSKETFQTKKLKKKEKEERSVNYLESINVMNAKETYNTLVNTMKGEKVPISSLYIKKEKK